MPGHSAVLADEDIPRAEARLRRFPIDPRVLEVPLPPPLPSPLSGRGAGGGREGCGAAMLGLNK